MKQLNIKLLIIVFCGILGVGSIVYIVSSVVPKTLVTLSKASSSGKLSINHSFPLGEVVAVDSNGVDKCIVNVFLMDKDSRPVTGESVKLLGAENIKQVNEASDSNGKVAFEITSTTKGQFELTASVEGVPLPKKVKVTFR